MNARRVCFGLLLFLVGMGGYLWYGYQRAIQWDWSSIDMSLTKQSFGNDFLWGVADSAYQVEGPMIYDDTGIENNWTEWQKRSGAIVDNQKIGTACDRWNRYKEDIDLIKASGFTAYRFSIPWDKVEPEQGRFDERVFDHYQDVIDYCILSGIKPVVCLFHFTYPLWFEDLGGFESTIDPFVQFATTLYKRFHDKVSMWLTFNEPTAFAAAGYFLGNFPPGKKSFLLYRKILFQVADAHIACYKAFKDINSRNQIGLCNNITLFDPYHWWNPIEVGLCGALDYIFNGSILTYLDQHNSLDFFGLNYYTHVVMKQYWYLGISPTHWHGEQIADNDSAIYPEGLYRALHQVAELKVPIFVTENGLADAHNQYREAFIKRHLVALKKAHDDGIDVRGYFYWTLLDNWEWDQGYNQKFGLYHTDFETQKRTLYESARWYIDWLKGVAT